MFKDLMHNLLGNSNHISGGTITAGNISSLGQVQAKRSNSRRIFHGNVEVQQVANGYVVNIGTREGYEYTTHIAQTITEVNEIIAAAMVAFQLENK
jgi:hypothetical protein